MQGVLMLSFANIRRRKTQALLIGLTLFMASLLLAAAIQMLRGMQDPAERMFAAQKGSHITMMMPEQTGNAHEVTAWWNAQQEVQGVVCVPYHMAEDDFRHNGTQQSMGGIMLSEHPAKPMDQDLLHIVEGAVKDSPGEGEVWLPTGYAYSWKLRVGDTLEIPVFGTYRAFTISAIVVDPQFSPSMMNPVRAWVSGGFFAELGKEGHELGSLMGVRLWDETQYDRLWQDFEAYLEAPYLGFVFEHTFVKHAYSMVQGILAVIMLAFSAIVILVALFVLGFTITNAVMSDYTIIGILKAQGFSPQQVRWVYVLQYVILAFLAAPLGVLASRCIVGAVMAQMTKSLGIAQFDTQLLLPAALTMSAILLSTVLAALLASAKAGKIKPAEAIRNTAPAPKIRGKWQPGLNTPASLPVSVLLAVKSIFSGKRHSAFLLVSGLVLAFVMAFSVNTFHSVKNMAGNYAYWGFDDADAYLSANVNAQLLPRDDMLALLYGDDRVQAALPYQVITTAAFPAQAGQSSKNIIGFTYDGDMDAIGALNLTGENPRRGNEIAISYMAAERYGKQAGDRIDLYLEGEQATYLVTGVYQCINAMGWGFRLQEEAVRRISPEACTNDYTVKLKHETDTAAFVEDMKALLGDSYTIRAVSESGEINLSEITGNIALVTVFLSLIFAGVAFIIIFNTTAMELYSGKKSLGIYSAMGMTPVQIRATVLWKALALSGAGMVLGIALALLASPNILGILIRNLGMARFPFDITLPGTLAVIPLCLAVTALSAWLPSGNILSVSARELVMD